MIGFTIGAEESLWSEQYDTHSLDSQVWPRASALAERLWSNPSMSWNKAERRMLIHRERLVKRGIGANNLKPEWCLQNQGYCH